MAMNIKSERVHALARQAAHLTGKSQTSVVEEALTQYLERIAGPEQEREQRVQELRAVIDEFRRGVTDEDRAAIRLFMDELYDENGLPA